MDKGSMSLKKCSTSTDVEHAHHINNVTKEEKKRKKSTAHDVNKATEHSQKMKKVGVSKKTAARGVIIHGLASTIENARDEIKKLTDSFKEMTETMNKLQESLLTKATDLPEKETPKQKAEHECLVATLASQLINERTIYVKGFDTCVPKDDIKSALIKHFESCGEVAWVVVFFQCGTVGTKGYALIEMKKYHSKALTLNESYLGGSKLKVMMATQKYTRYGRAIGRGGFSGLAQPRWVSRYPKRPRQAVLFLLPF